MKIIRHTHKIALESKVVHPRIRALSHVWSLQVTWQRRRLHQSIHHSWKPHATCKLHGSMFYRTGVTADCSSTLREYGFWTFSAPVTLTRWPSYMNLTHIP